MSEKEKQKRADYRKNREKWIFAQSLIIAVITVAIIISSIVTVKLNKSYFIRYNQTGNIDYDVFLKDNDFYEEDHLGKNQSYVASLIDKIIADFNYAIEMDAENVNYKYSYSITSRLEIIDDTSKVPIYNPEYELVNVQNKVQNSSNRLVINEMVVLNYDEYNNLAGRFLETYGLKKTTSNIVVTLKVNVLSDCNTFSSGDNSTTYKSELRIPLTTQTVNIKMTSQVPNDESKMIACAGGAGSEVFKTTAIVLGVFDALLIIVLIAFIYLTRTDDITYTAKVKRILSQYKSYIQKIKNLFNTAGYQLVIVDSFDELLEIRDTIQAPILMHENEDKTCTKFVIPTDSKLLYMYEIKIEGYTDPEPEPAAEPAPTTICKPNITNVVRPVVKVVVAPGTSSHQDADIKTIVEDAEIEINTNGNSTPVVSASVEDLKTAKEYDENSDEINELLASIPMVECESMTGTLDAIDVVLSDVDGKTYRYDPDGNSVDRGDIVLVPTKDEESDKEIVREAEVSRGNYKISSSSVQHPLKKIIGVVRRRATKVFNAMITPDDETK